MLSPADYELISEGSEQRRKFIDSVVSQYDKSYLENLISYNKALSQRNALLKQFASSRKFDEGSLEIWNDQLVNLGTAIHAVRIAFIEKFLPIFQQYYELISGGKEKVELVYRSHLNKEEFSLVLKNALKRDLALEYTTVGIHKDDLDFLIMGHPIKKYASQGQQKSYLIALRLAQFSFIRNIKDMIPILLLDDIYDKLDENRVKHLMEIVSKENFGQIFITDTHHERLPALFNLGKDKFRHFMVENGNVKAN
jgi:DNA replication and repair protein RecF